ncbi:ricin-type beta-trefoil lectin domain protein [Kalamiella sp. sgz302252]|uniref:ricin-type beta-trefoil lectin domain protein n=1 Tax=Pantoea sp. sgz302252 TaxID=3341827 RepID=UPI0036D3902B
MKYETVPIKNVWTSSPATLPMVRISFCTPCTKNPNQNFIYEDFQLKYVANKSYCIDVNRDKSGSLVLWKCNGGKNQKFTFANGFIYPHDYPEQCLTYKYTGPKPIYEGWLNATASGSAGSSPYSDGYYIWSRQCEKGSTEKFSIPKYCLYIDSNYSKPFHCGDKNIAFLSPNDAVSSVSVINSSVNLYEHIDCKGTIFTINKNIAYVGNSFNDKASSITVPEEEEFIITSDPQVWCGVTNCNVDN